MRGEAAEQAFARTLGYKSRVAVSVVIPAYNAAATIEACLGALRRQTRPPGEVVVVDDRSTDATARIAAGSPHAATLRLRVVTGDGRGPGPARNRGSESATGSVFAFVDADCVPADDWLERLLAPLERSAATVASAGVVTAHAPRGAIETLQALLLPPSAGSDPPPLTRFDSPRDGVSSASLAIRADAFREIGGFDPRLRWCEDTLIAAQLLRRGGEIARVGAAVAHRAPSTIGGLLRRPWKYGASHAAWFRLAWKRKTFVDLSRALRFDSERLPGRVWIAGSPDKIVAAFLLPALAEPRWALVALVPLGYYALDFHRRARARGLTVGPAGAAALVPLSLLYHAVLTAGRLWGSPRGRSFVF